MRSLLRPGAVRSRVLWLALAAAALFCGIAVLPGADAGSFLGGVPVVDAAAAPNPLWLSERETAALASIKANAALGTPAGAGPSANVGQTIQLKGAALGAGVASFAGFDGTDVTAPLTSVKPAKKGKVTVPSGAVSGDVSVIPDGGTESTTLPLLVVPTISTLSSKTIAAGDTLTIDGSGFTPALTVSFPGVATPVAVTTVDTDSATVTVPEGVQKGKVGVITNGGTSNTVKVKVAAGLANRSLATDPQTGLVLATDDVRNTLEAIDPATGAVERSAEIPADAEWIGLVEGTRLVAIGEDDRVLMTFDLDAWAPQASALETKASWAPADALPVAGGRVTVADSPTTEWSLALDAKLESARRSPDGRRAVALAGDAGKLYVIDLASRAVVAVRELGAPIEGAAFSPDGRTIYTIDRASGRLLSVSAE